jgi:hypothetical protein
MNPAPPVISARRFEGDAATPKPYRRRRRWSSERLPKLISDPVFAGIPVVRDSGDPQVAARTIARLVPTEEVAEAVRLQLGSDLSRSALLAAVSAHAHDEWPRPWLLVPVALAVGAAIGLALLVVARRRRPSRAVRELVRRAGELVAPDATGGWKIDDLERLVDAHRATSPTAPTSGRRTSSTCASTPTPRGSFRPSSTLSSTRRSATSSLPTRR